MTKKLKKPELDALPVMKKAGRAIKSTLKNSLKNKDQKSIIAPDGHPKKSGEEDHATEIIESLVERGKRAGASLMKS